MKNEQAEVNSKGHLVIPKEIRHQFHLVPGSTVKLEVEGDRIILTPHALVDAMEKIIVDTLKKAGLKNDPASLQYYHFAMKQAFDNMTIEVAEEKKKTKEETPVSKKQPPKKK
jgi:AbrB family looped-hinge helix DNA binding protein